MSKNLDRVMAADIRKSFNLSGIIKDLKKTEWYWSEPRRLDRITFIVSYDGLISHLRGRFSRIMAEAGEAGFEHEVAEDYTKILGEILTRLTREHVYVTFEEGDVFAGQYEDFANKAEGERWVAKRGERIQR